MHRSEAVGKGHSWDLVVEEEQINGVPPFGGIPHHLEGGFRVEDAFASYPPKLGVGLENMKAGTMAMHETQMKALQVRRRRLVEGILFHDTWESNRKPELATLTGCAGKADGSPHLFHQLLADGQSQSRAPELSGRGFIRLAKGFKQAGLAFWRNADARVTHLHPNGLLVRVRVQIDQFDNDFALLGELNGVPNQIRQDLFDAPGITSDLCGHPGRDNGH